MAGISLADPSGNQQQTQTETSQTQQTQTSQQQTTQQQQTQTSQTQQTQTSTTSSDPFAGLNEANRTIAQAKGWKSMDDALSSYTSLEKQFSSTRPHVKPEKADAYKFDVPKDLPKGMNYSADFEGAYRNWAFDAELSADQASKLHSKFFGFAAEQAKAAQDALVKNVEGAAGALTQKWGTPDSPTFKQNVEMAKRAIRHLDPNLKGALEQAGVIAKVGNDEMVGNATVFEVLAKVGLSLFAEDSLYGQTAADKNPFSKETEDLAMQGRILKEDPNKAKLLIMASGRSAMFQHILDKYK